MSAGPYSCQKSNFPLSNASVTGMKPIADSTVATRIAL